MKVLFASSEIKPYAATGSLADVSAGLTKELAVQGVEVVRVVPMYRSVLDDDQAAVNTGVRLQIPVGLKTLQAEIWQARQEPLTYFVRRDEYFDRRELYSLPDRDYDDNCERFIFFQKAVVGLIDRLDLAPDVVHTNGWQTGLIPYFLDFGINGMGRVRKERVVHTVHNLAYQGVFPDFEYPNTNLPYSCFSVDEMEFYGKINFMKGGIVRCDRLNTLSKRYAEDMLTPEFGFGLEGVLGDAARKMRAIVSGVDYTDWDPDTDTWIAAQYNSDDLSGKAICKRALLDHMGLPFPVDAQRKPVLGMVTRLVAEKGLDLLDTCMEAIMAADVYLVVLGLGQHKYHAMCRRWAAKWPARIAVHIGYDTALAHQIEAGADMFMMPSRHEPCGLNQLYSLRYGTLPIVHATGGLDDTIDPINVREDAGNGFKFQEYSSAGLLGALNEALTLFKDRMAWCAVQRRVMRQQFSWGPVANEYCNLYRDAMN